MRICHYCGKEANTRDHIIPRSRGGPTTKWNLVDACAPCNSAKAAKWPLCKCGKCLDAIRIFNRSGGTKDDVAKQRRQMYKRKKKSNHLHICSYYCDRYTDDS